MPKHILILYSGGLDSMIMYNYAKHKNPTAKITALYFDIGHGYNYKEMEQLPDFVEVRKIDWMGGAVGIGKDGNSAGSIYIPGRNLAFVVNAACMFTPDEIWLGALCGEEHREATDKNEMFRSLVNATLRYVLSPYNIPTVRFPFVEDNMGKLDITRWALNNGIPSKTIIDSSSCMSATEKKCGTCIVCARRWGIFTQLGISEEYNTFPLSSEEVRKHITKVITDDGSHYDSFRKAEFIPALEKFFGQTDLDTIVYLLEKEIHTNA